MDEKVAEFVKSAKEDATAMLSRVKEVEDAASKLQEEGSLADVSSVEEQILLVREGAGVNGASFACREGLRK